MGRIIGIDLGTTNSCVAVIENGQPLVVPNPDGGATTPSVVAFTHLGEVLVGERARRQAATNPQRTIYGVKRLIGQRANSSAVEQWTRTLPYKVTSNDIRDAVVDIDGTLYTPQEISAHVLQYLKESAEAYLGDTVEEAVITVPAYFNDSQRQATKDAARIAGLRCRRVLNEPTAAALAFGAKKDQDPGHWAVFDLGGGTLDVSILSHDEGVFEVLATAGDTALGGCDFDDALLEVVAADFEKETGVDLRADPAALQRVREAVEITRCDLSVAQRSDINLAYIGEGPDGPVHLERSITRELLLEVTEALLLSLAQPANDAQSEVIDIADQIGRLLLVGGMTRMPAVRELASRLFKLDITGNINPDQVVAIGAAWQAASMSGDVADALLLDVTPQDLGVATKDGVVSRIIERNRTIPTEERKRYITTRDNQDFVSIEIYQGNERLADNNTHLGRFTLKNLPPGPAGSVEVAVRFHIDVNGLIRVSARHEATGQDAEVTVKAKSGLSTSEVDELASARGN